MGYQGWFGCPKDGAGAGWNHWFDGHTPTIDMLPDVSELSPEERCDTGLFTADHKPIFVFSSRDPATVRRHFAWMRQYGIDGVAVGRFGVAIEDPASRSAVDQVLDNVRQAAEAEGRLFFVEYDLSGMQSTDLALVAADWQRLQNGGLTGSPAYARHRGRPVLGVWGLGFGGRELRPEAAARLMAALRAEGAPRGGVTLLGGVPAGWRTDSADADPDPAWGAVYRSLDIISPWAVGRFGDDAGADNFLRERIRPDLLETRRLGIDYMPVVFPGFSWKNLMDLREPAKHARINEIPRRCGRFYWHQVSDAVAAGVTMLFGAMFDEVDEGTAMFKMLPSHAQSPAEASFLTLDADGCRLPSDWYLRLAGAAQQLLDGAIRPSPELPIPLPKQ